MRSDFVSSVTHELKCRSPHSGDGRHARAAPDGRREDSDYAEYLLQEARRLTRLVDNLLAYARVTDVTNLYSFERSRPLSWWTMSFRVSGNQSQIAM